MNTKEMSKHILSVSEAITYITSNLDGHGDDNFGTLASDLVKAHKYMVKIRNKQLYNNAKRKMKRNNINN